MQVEIPCKHHFMPAMMWMCAPSVPILERQVLSFIKDAIQKQGLGEGLGRDK